MKSVVGQKETYTAIQQFTVKENRTEKSDHCHLKKKIQSIAQLGEKHLPSTYHKMDVKWSLGQALQVRQRHR